MSNPCVSRWGLSSFWHHFWYSDVRYSLYVQQDKVIVDLVQLYIQYGTVRSSVFSQKWFWYKTSPQPTYLSIYRYYRWVTSEGRDPSESYTTSVRLAASEVFQTRVSVLRFDSWILINIYWFQPDKQRNKRAKRSRLSYTAVPLFDSAVTNSHLTKLNFLQQVTAARSPAPIPPYAF